MNQEKLNLANKLKDQIRIANEKITQCQTGKGADGYSVNNDFGHQMLRLSDLLDEPIKGVLLEIAMIRAKKRLATLQSEFDSL